MKKRMNLLLVFVMLFAVAGCSKAENAKPMQSAATAEDAEPAQFVRTEESSDIEAENTSKNLIAYFSRYGNIDSTHEVDAISSASVLVKDGEMMGNMEYVAHLVQENVGGDLYFIETAEKYSSDYDNTDNNELDIQAEKEQRENARPALAAHIDNMDEYGTVFLCFPNWYSDMPMAVYSFLDEYDLSGKTIVVFTSSGGGRVGSIDTIRELEPDANVADEEFTVSHSRIEALKAEDIQDWLREIGYIK